MKKIIPIMIALILAANLALAQYKLNWVKYDLINPTSDLTRCAVYNPFTDHVLVATRVNGPNIYILSAATGDTIGRMNMTDVAGGTYPVNQVAVDAAGIIYCCNLSAPQYTPGSTFKIYRYTDESAAPVVVFDNSLNNDRYGDSFSVVGSGENLYVYSSGYQSDKIVVLKGAGNGDISIEGSITTPTMNSARHGISPVTPGGNLWINGAGDTQPPPRLISNTGVEIAVVPDTLASAGGTSTILHLILGKYKFVSLVNAFLSNSVRSVRYYEDQLGTVTFGYLGGNSDSLLLSYQGTTNNNNVNGSATLSYDSRRHSLITVMGVNSIASVSLDSLIKASTPRADVWDVSVDGSMDFFPTDHVGRSGGRDMYLTWSDGKVYTAFTGQTLIDATLSRRMFLVFDLDPDGPNGSTTPPENAGNVQSLPFKADVVIMTESYNQPDYMIGEIYKWNGSQWVDNVTDLSDYRGNDASQGVLAYSSDGDTALTEIAAVRNDAGIGNTFTSLSVMAYLAESGTSGNVLAAFPGINPTGNGISLSAYYHIPVLGSGMFPTDTNYVQIRGEGVSAIGKDTGELPQVFKLYPNVPNPFNPRTEIRFDISKPGDIQLDVFDLSGRLVQTLINTKLAAGTHRAVFDGMRASSGVYFYRLTIDHRSVATRKMVLIK